MLIKGITVSAALVVLAPGAMAGEQSGLLRKASCTLVRYYVAKYSADAAEAWARAHGASDAEIATARHCLKDAPQRPVTTAGWAGQ